LTAADSATIRALYQNFAQLESLAAWMSMERWIPSDPKPSPSTIKAGNLTNYERARAAWIADSRQEELDLPPVIPANVVIDVGSTRTTNNATMWLPAGSRLRFQPNVVVGDSVQSVLASLNLDSRTYGDWRVPSQGELTTLLTGFKPAPAYSPD